MLNTLKQYSSIISDYKVNQYEIAGSSQKLRAILYFVNESELHVRITIIDGIQVKYSFHWQDKDKNIIIRWDNAPDWDLHTFPHHKHVGSQDCVEVSYERTLEQVLDVINIELTNS